MVARGGACLVGILLLSLVSCSRQPTPRISLWRNQVTQEEYRLLDRAFRSALQDGDLGAVLFGDKPIWLAEVAQGPSIPNSEMGLPSTTHSCLYYQACRVWEHLSDNVSNFSLVAGRVRSAGLNEFACFFVNHRALLETVETHIALFRLILGPHVTPSAILTRLTTPGVDIRHALGESTALLGIVLGYGVDNAVAEERVFQLRDFYYASERPPYQLRQLCTDTQCDLESVQVPPFVFWGAPSWAGKPVSYEHATIADELRSLDQRTILSMNHTCARGQNVPWFGVIEDSAETRVILERYQVAAIRTDELLSRENMLDVLMEIICD
jgi:hypothetical protein